MRKPSFVYGACAAVLAAASAGCNVRPITSFVELLLIPPRAIPIVNNNAVAAPGQAILLDASNSGVVLGDDTFRNALASNLLFNWTIVAATESATGQQIPLANTGAVLQNGTSSQVTFSAQIPADYQVSLTLTSPLATGQAFVIVRIQ